MLEMYQDSVTSDTAAHERIAMEDKVPFDNGSKVREGRRVTRRTRLIPAKSTWVNWGVD